LVGTELPYLTLAESFRPLGSHGGPQAGGWLAAWGVRGEVGAAHRERSCATVLLVLEDLALGPKPRRRSRRRPRAKLHAAGLWLLADKTGDEQESAGRMRRLAEGVRRSGSAARLEPVARRDEATALLRGPRGASLPCGCDDNDSHRSEGNPLFAEELLAAAGEEAATPSWAGDLLLQGVARHQHRPGPVDAWPRQPDANSATADPRNTLAGPRGSCATRRQAVEHGSSRRAGDRELTLPHALLGGGRFYATILPGERERVHAWLAESSERRGDGREQRACAATGRRRRRPAEAFVPLSKRPGKRRMYSPR